MEKLSRPPIAPGHHGHNAPAKIVVSWYQQQHKDVKDLFWRKKYQGINCYIFQYTYLIDT